MRLIDADALIPMMKYATTDSEIGVFPIKIGFNDIEKVINEQPTVNTATMIESLPSADRPQGWVDKAISIIDAMQKEGIIGYEQAWEFRMRARMKGADDE